MRSIHSWPRWAVDTVRGTERRFSLYADSSTTPFIDIVKRKYRTVNQDGVTVGDQANKTRLMAGAALLGAGALLFTTPGVAAADGSVSVGSVDSGSAESIGEGILNAFVPGLGDAVTGSLDSSAGGLGGGGNVAPTQTQRCNQSRQSGGYGITSTKHLMGRRGPFGFTIVYDTLNQPDRIQVYYQGRQVYNTGLIGDRINEGNGSKRIQVPAGADNFVTVKVTGPEEGTRWDYTVYCPS